MDAAIAFTVLGSCDESSLLGVVKAIAMKGVHKEVYRAAFQGMHQQQGELYQAHQRSDH